MGKTKGLFELAKPSLARWFLRVGLNWIEICALFFMGGYADHWLGYLFMTLLLGTRIHALAIMAHDAAHGCILRNRTLNDLVGSVFTFWPLGFGLDAYRNFHFQHHCYLKTDKDPELIHRSHFASRWSLPKSRMQILKDVLKDLIGFGVPEVLMAVKFFYPRTLKDRLGVLLVTISLLCVLWKTGQLWVLPYWYLTLFTSFWASFRLRMWTEHMGEVEVQRVKVKPWQRFLFAPHNTWAHFEHHKWPNIPSWNLPKARPFESSTPVLSVEELYTALGDSENVEQGSKSDLNHRSFR